MTENVSNLLLEQLRLPRNEIQTFRLESNRRLDDLTVRVGAVERNLDQVQIGLGHIHDDHAAMQERIDQIEARFRPVERRLDLVETPAGPLTQG